METSNDATAASGSAPSPMLPADQVAAMLQQLKLEHEVLLEQQRETIVLQVMKSLQERGVLEPSTKTSPKKSRSSVALERNIHALVLHSLEESGLDFPHVQRNRYVEASSSGEEPLSGWSKAIVRHNRTNKVISRPEANDGVVVSLTNKEGNEDVHEPQNRSTLSNHSQSKAKTTNQPKSRAIRHSPLRDYRTDQISYSRERKTNRRRRVVPNNESSSDQTGQTDESFSSARSKVDHKTLAILDRSRQLLSEVKQSRGNVQTSQSDVFRVQKTQVIRQTVRESECDEQQFTPASSNCAYSKENCEPPVLDKNGSNDAAMCCSNANAAESTEEAHTEVDIELLKRPDKAPENEGEWENELARQILTIYATSVKAKASTKGGDRSTRGSSRPVSSTAGTERATRLEKSCSLPAISRTPPSTGHQGISRQGQALTRSVVHYSWEPSHRLGNGRVVVNMPKVPKPIWFAGSGAVKAVWCGLAQGFLSLQVGSPSPPKQRSRDASAVCEHRVCEEVRHMESKQQYMRYITTLENLLISLVRARGADDLEVRLWKQLVVTSNAFASRCIDYKKYGDALQLMKQAEHLIHNSILVGDAMRLELLAYVYDTYAYYYYRRRKPHAGLQYIQKAHDIHSRQSSWAHLAKCRLHVANILSFQGQHIEAMRHMAKVLEMIEENKLEDQGEHGGDGASAQKICLTAVCYNNLAVEQLYLREFEGASVSIGNAKRLARLCLSYSNRWLAQFEATNDCVDLAIATLMEDINADANAKYKLAKP